MVVVVVVAVAVAVEEWLGLVARGVTQGPVPLLLHPSMVYVARA